MFPGDFFLEPFILCIKIYCISFQPIEGWRENLDKTYYIEEVLLGISKTFDGVSYNILFANLLAYGVDDTLQIPDSHYEKKNTQNEHIIAHFEYFFACHYSKTIWLAVNLNEIKIINYEKIFSHIKQKYSHFEKGLGIKNFFFCLY